MIRHEDVYNIGTITKTHALKGEVVFQFTDDIFDTADADYLIIEVDGLLVPFFIDEYRFRSDSSALMKFDGIDTADQAQPIVGSPVFIEKSKAQAAERDEMSLNYFVGFTMVNDKGETLGNIANIDDQTENWLFVVERSDGSELLVPAHEAFIADIDHEARLLTMTLPTGLLDL